MTRPVYERCPSLGETSEIRKAWSRLERGVSVVEFVNYKGGRWRLHLTATGLHAMKRMSDETRI